MIEMQETPIPSQLTTADIQAKVKNTTYALMSDLRTTVCQITLENGYTVIGTSSCVDPKNYSRALGENYAYEDAFSKIWPLEGYLLRQRRFEAGLV